MNNDFNSNSRSGYRAKRKKTNLILNSLIVIVLVLIIVVAFSIFSSNGDKAASNKDAPVTGQTNKDSKKDTSEKPKDEQTSGDKSDDSGQSEDPSGEEPGTDTDEDAQPVVTDGGSDSNILKTIENPAWKPVGTLQSGPHTAAYDGSSIDWQEMINAISYATGLEQNNMIVHFLGRDKTQENASVGTVYSKDKQEKYKVYIKWVDGEGWQPTRVEELAEIK